MKRIAVFCGANAGSRPDYAAAASALGVRLAERGLGLVFGGGGVGLMGCVADAALERGGEVIGVLPRALMTRELAHPRVADLRVVASMHERKALMAELADAFLALPGGFGTLDESFEILTWLQLGFHRKPFGLLNVAGYYDELRAFLERGVTEAFVRRENVDEVLVETDPDRLLDRLLGHQPRQVTKWLTRETL